MKLKYIIPSFIAALTMMVSCSEDNEPTYLDEVQVSSSYVTFAAEGGSTSIELTAKGDWTVTGAPEWVSISPAQGGAGKQVVTFTADAATETREATAFIECLGKKQTINLMQQTEKVDLPVSTCAEVIAGPDSKTFRVKGTCTKIANTQYGNWYLQDETGEVYIYGTVDGSGSYNWASFGIEVGDEVTVEGPKTTYNGTVELVDVAVISVNKSLIKVVSVDPEDATLPLEGGDFTVTLDNKGNGVSVQIPEAAKSWLSVTGITTGATSVVSFHAAANEGGDRKCDLTFATTDGKKSYTATATLNQKGAIIECPIADFNAAEVGDTQYRLTGIITSVASAEKGRFYIKDYSGETYVYNLTGFDALGLKAGDVVTVVGKRDQYKETIEMTSAVVESSKTTTEVSLADFPSQEDGAFYMISGIIDEIANDSYGNLYLTDGENRVYVYGCYPGYGATGDNRKGLIAALGIKVGDKLTVVGPKSVYKDAPQINGGFYFSHESAEATARRK